jgi:Holliday junction resolvase RusA-like endonuclease
MSYISVHIHGIPYSRVKNRGKVEAPAAWSKAVVEQTRHLAAVREACILKVTFLLPPDKYPKDFPYGPDLDNLLKRFLDALGHTIFRDTRGGDSCVVSLFVVKTRVESEAEAGALLEVLPVSVGSSSGVTSPGASGRA